MKALLNKSKLILILCFPVFIPFILIPYRISPFGSSVDILIVGFIYLKLFAIFTIACNSRVARIILQVITIVLSLSSVFSNGALFTTITGMGYWGKLSLFPLYGALVGIALIGFYLAQPKYISAEESDVV